MSARTRTWRETVANVGSNPCRGESVSEGLRDLIDEGKRVRFGMDVARKVIELDGLLAVAFASQAGALLQ